MPEPCPPTPAASVLDLASQKGLLRASDLDAIGAPIIRFRSMKAPW